MCGVIVGNSGLNNMNIQSDSAVPVQVYCVDANHCPGAVCIIFTLPNGKVRICICISYLLEMFAFILFSSSIYCCKFI